MADQTIEIRYLSTQPEQDTGLDSANVAALAQRNATGTTPSGSPYGGRNTSGWAQHGRMLYVHGGGMDQPLGLIRMDYSYDFPEPVVIVPHASWRGVYEAGSFIASACKSVSLPSYEVVEQDSTGHAVRHPNPQPHLLPTQLPGCLVHRTVEKGGPIRPGLRVRISHVNGNILRLEVAP